MQERLRARIDILAVASACDASVWVCVGICGYVWVCVDMCGYVESMCVGHGRPEPKPLQKPFQIAYRTAAEPSRVVHVREKGGGGEGMWLCAEFPEAVVGGADTGGWCGVVVGQSLGLELQAR